LSICEKHIWPAFKLLLSAGTPIQKLIGGGGETHLFLNRQGLLILKNDNRTGAHNLAEKYKSVLDLGNLWADQGWKCFAHYYKPQTGKGFIPWISAINEGCGYFQLALTSWKAGKPREAMFYLGATAHIIQDMCVPHHAMGIAFNGHRKFELWALSNKDQYKQKYGAEYKHINDIGELISGNAIIAQMHYDNVAYYSNKYANSGKEMLLLAQKSTATLYDYFYKTALTPQKQ